MKMKFRKIMALICILGLSAGIAIAAPNSKKNEQKTEYTNEIHSVFALKDCVDIAIENNPTIRAYIYNEDVYKSKIGQAWANYFPSISAGINVSRSGTKYSHAKQQLPMGYRSTYNTMGYIPSVSADMLLFDFGKTKASADSAKRMYEASQENTKENINAIIYDIKSTYYNILFAQAQVKVYEDTVKDYELQLKQAWGFYKYGTKPKIDVVTAEYNLGKAKLNLVKAKNILEVAQVQLSKIMGIPEYTNYELSDELILNKYDTTVEDALKTAMDVRPELLSAEKMAKAAKMNLRATRREFLPDLGAYGSYENGLGNDYNMRSAQAGVSLNYSNLNLLKVKKQVNEARAEYQKTMAEYDAVKHDVYLNVKKNYLELQTAEEAIVIAKLALDQAKEQYRQVTGRYRAGVGDAIELKDGENTYLNARLDFYNAMLNYNVTAASLEREIGVPLVFSDEFILDIKPEDL
jgi:Outer membrane protein